MENMIKLPCSGTLNIEDYDKFLEDSKEEINKLWELKFKNDCELDDFDIIKILGIGAYGKVFLIQRKTIKNLHAMKILEKQYVVKTKQIESVRREINILKCLNYPFTVCLDYFFKTNRFLYLIMPFVNGGEMFDHIQELVHFKENVSRFYGAQIVLAFEYLHNSNILYRDLKPENVLIDQTGYAKISDFGFSKIVNTRTYTLCGTPEYFAPEIILNQGYGKSVDLWTLGVFLFEMTSGYTPFTGIDPMQMHEKTINGKYTMPTHFSPELKNLIKNILQVDITKRLGNMKNGMKDIKVHAWFQPIQWMSVLNRLMISPYIPKITHPNLNKSYSKQLLGLIEGDKELFSQEFKDF